MKRQIKRTDYEFLEKEIDFYKENDIITYEQQGTLLNLYEIKQNISFIRVIVTIGAILIGLGILSFIASNWDGMSKLLRLAIIFCVYLAVNLIGYRLNHDYPKTGRSLLYLGVLVYGAGIFLIGQMFNFGGAYALAFLLWSLGIIPLCLHQKDSFLMLFANILFVIYVILSRNGVFPWPAFICIPALYLAFWNLGKPRILLYCANLTTLYFFLYLSLRLNIEGFYTSLFFFVIGLLMYFIKHNFQHDIFKFQGNVVFGIAGVFLTFPDLWNTITTGQNVLATIIFAIAFLVLLFYLIKNGSLTSLLFVCVVIFRYYMDTFQFLPKSIFFIIGGLLLLGFGFYFERVRKKSKGGIKA